MALVQFSFQCLIWDLPFFSLFFSFLFFLCFWLRWVFIAAHGLSLVAASGGYSSLWCAGFLLLWPLLLRSTGSRCTGLSSCGTRAQLLWLAGSRAQAQQLWCMGLAAPWHVGSSQTRARIHVPRISRRIPNHCATREVQDWPFLNSLLTSSFYMMQPLDFTLSINWSWSLNSPSLFSTFQSYLEDFHLNTLIYSFFLKFLFIYLFIYGCVGSSFRCEDSLQLRQAGATLHRGARASHYRSLSCCGAQAPDAQAQ